MRGRIVVFFLLMITIATPLMENSSAQSVAAAVDLQCNPPNGGSIDVEVHPGATMTGYTICTVSNPTIHVEKISISVQGQGLAVAAPGSITVAAGGEEDFQVSVRADSRMFTQAMTLLVNAYVQEISGAPPPNTASSDSTNIVNIVQFAEFNIEMLSPIVELEVGSGYQLEYRLYNTGNGLDTFSVNLNHDKTDSASFSLPTTRIQAEPWYGSWFRVLVDSPNDGSDWGIDSDGRHTLEMDIQVTFESDLGCQKGNCLTTTVVQKVIFYQNQTIQDESESNLLSSSIDSQVLIYGGGGTIAILLITLFVIILRRK